MALMPTVAKKKNSQTSKGIIYIILLYYATKWDASKTFYYY